MVLFVAPMSVSTVVAEVLAMLPTRNTPAAPRSAVKFARPLMFTVSLPVFTAPVAPPTWKVPPARLTARFPPPRKFRLVTAPRAEFAPMVTTAAAPPVKVSVLPGAIVIVFAVAVFVCTFSEPKVELKVARSRFAAMAEP